MSATNPSPAGPGAAGLRPGDLTSDLDIERPGSGRGKPTVYDRRRRRRGCVAGCWDGARPGEVAGWSSEARST